MNPPDPTKATSLRLFDFRSVPTRVFHITWVTFFLCFFGWFGIASLMPVVREDLGLTKTQIGHIIIASVAITIFARLFFGWLCDRIGPRISYSLLLAFGSLPVMGIGLSNSYESFLLFRLAIGVIGASFVITQYHTTAMFAPNVVGTANAVAAGWGNMGGGVTLAVMPLVLAGFTGLGFTPFSAWRYAMILPGVILLIMAFVYYRFAPDTPDGQTSFKPNKTSLKTDETDTISPWRDRQVWALFLAYGGCFGIEITVDNIAALYFVDNFNLGLKEAGFIAGSFGLMNIFARALGGIYGDKAGKKFGLRGRVFILAMFLLLEGLGIIFFSSMTMLPWAIAGMLLFALFLKMSNGATFAVVPFVNRKAMGTVSGIVGAGGNVGAVLAGILFTSEELSYRDGFFVMGICVVGISFVIFLLSYVVKGRTSTLPEAVSALAVGLSNGEGKTG
jgi:NNP family nitrate/nitrite transporter-like MFS transporter